MVENSMYSRRAGIAANSIISNGQSKVFPVLESGRNEGKAVAADRLCVGRVANYRVCCCCLGRAGVRVSEVLYDVLRFEQ